MGHTLIYIFLGGGAREEGPELSPEAKQNSLDLGSGA
jgi:hypothetical protein